MKLTAIK